MKKHIHVVLAVILAIGVSVQSVMAEESSIAATKAQSVIEDNVARDVAGYLGINMAAGDMNAQSNANVIVIGEARGKGVGQVNQMQMIDASSAVMPSITSSEIKNNAFSNARGAIGINQASGVANAQANSVLIGIGSEISLDAELAQTVAGPMVAPSADGTKSRRADVSDSAFVGASGIVQLNQSAGAGNATANSFSMRIQTESMQ